jgi:hypothetical protein
MLACLMANDRYANRWTPSDRIPRKRFWFLQSLERLVDHPGFDDSGMRLTRADVGDRSKAFSIYSYDPNDNRYKITTKDYCEVIQQIFA